MYLEREVARNDRPLDSSTPKEDINETKWLQVMDYRPSKCVARDKKLWAIILRTVGVQVAPKQEEELLLGTGTDCVKGRGPRFISILVLLDGV